MVTGELSGKPDEMLGGYTLVSGRPRVPIPRGCGALAGDFSGFRL